VEKACIAFLHAAEATELEREAKRREEAADAALHEVAKSLLEVTKAHPRTRAAAKAQKAFQATGLVALESGTIYDPETTFCLGGLPLFR
jgi:predicted RNA-binding Zn ribbon-like protein